MQILKISIIYVAAVVILTGILVIIDGILSSWEIVTIERLELHLIEVRNKRSREGIFVKTGEKTYEYHYKEEEVLFKVSGDKKAVIIFDQTSHPYVSRKTLMQKHKLKIFSRMRNFAFEHEIHFPKN